MGDWKMNMRDADGSIGRFFLAVFSFPPFSFLSNKDEKNENAGELKNAPGR
jgi:hypothetical protein